MKFSQEQLEQLEDLFDRKLAEQRSQLIVDMGEMIEQNVLPQFHETKETVDYHDRVLVASTSSRH